jgi:hypothetical protein
MSHDPDPGGSMPVYVPPPPTDDGTTDRRPSSHWEPTTGDGKWTVGHAVTLVVMFSAALP